MYYDEEDAYGSEGEFQGLDQEQFQMMMQDPN